MSRDPRRLSDQDLLAALARSLDQSNHSTVDFLLHLAEVDARQLYLAQACSSTFTYCVERLHMAESSTQRRLLAARAGRRFPVVFDMLRRGELHLTAVAKIAPLLTSENHLDLLARAKHQTTRSIERLVAELRPRPDLPDLVRRLPAARPPGATAVGAAVLTPCSSEALVFAALPLADAAVDGVPHRPPPSVPAAQQPSMPPLPSAPSSTPAPRIQPTAADRYRISFTADEELVQVLDEVRDLLAHQVQRADVAAVFKRALRSLRDDLERQRKASTKQPSKQPSKQPTKPAQLEQPEQAKQAPTPSTTAPATPPVPSRHVPNAIRREVWRRDGGRCTFTSATGQRCSETSLLELDHLRPFAVHHEHRADEITLRCRSHNQWGATLVYGRAHMARFRRRRR